ncbi:divalent-cation tolerance protein CutA [Nannocystis pusilla]|uniref:Divalent-cation tolerance protein CutA n=1 Tax=Nannocystis pusilla TaxID=889268 RepID=A0ABS7TWI8_9BACT|nr:divalent-cation tolerance protein CutA [Nannocystis pusilla]
MHGDSPDLQVILMTCPPDQAEKILLALLERRLVGCGNIIPLVRSRYWWDGQICSDDEALVVMETTRDRLDALYSAIPEVHPYSVPKVVALQPSACGEPYVQWLRAVTRPA